MNFISGKRIFISSLLFQVCLAGLLLFNMSGCAPESENTGEYVPVLSLLTVTPLIGDEISVRTPAPSTSRIIIDNTSVAGWVSPPERILRFPVEIKSGARLMTRVGVMSDERINTGDIILKLGFLPHTPDGETVQSDPDILLTSGPEQSPELTTKWTLLDIPLNNYSDHRGELWFIAEGRSVNNRTIELLWGQPVIYYPNSKLNRNVLLIGVDALRADSTSPYGARPDLTPNIQNFSEGATLFEQARSQSSWTLPSFASMITGQLPSVIEATLFSNHIPTEATTISEILLPMGFATETICSNAYLGNKQSGFHQGVESMWFQASAEPHILVEKSCEFISGSEGRDWFLFLHILDPHGPYTPKDKYISMFCDPEYSGPYQEEFHANDWKAVTERPFDADIRQVRNLYDSEMANVDDAIGELLDFISDLGIMDETLVIIASDHGEEFFEHGGYEHGHNHFDEMVKTPLIVKGVDFPEGNRIDTQVGNTDIVPTILNWLKLPVPDGLHGVPLQDVITGNVEDGRFIYGEGNNRGTHRKFAVMWPYKCILDMVTLEFRLYNLEADPGETEDISEDNIEVTQLLIRKMLAEMVTDQTLIYLWFIANPFQHARNFTGSIRIPEGIHSVQSFGLDLDDHFELDGDTLRFEVANSLNPLEADKHFILVPSPDAETIEADLLVNGMIDTERFFPHGTPDPERTGSIILRIEDYPLGPNLPLDILALRPGFYIWCSRGIPSAEPEVELDEETLEQLRALGYLDQ